MWHVKYQERERAICWLLKDLFILRIQRATKCARQQVFEIFTRPCTSALLVGRDHFYIINATLDQLLSCKTMKWAQVGLYSCTASTGKLWGGHMDNRSEDKGGGGIARPFQIPEMFNVTSWGHGSLEARRELKRETFLTLVNLWSGIISPSNRLQLRF